MFRWMSQWNPCWMSVRCLRNNLDVLNFYLNDDITLAIDKKLILIIVRG